MKDHNRMQALEEHLGQAYLSVGKQITSISYIIIIQYQEQDFLTLGIPGAFV